ncbi:MAG: CDP-alcohol phosphatidyltransferase family protein [Deltaproteobacteria bacterium]|nr:CDP-alcohol phosphatidyltransferase family protein [Deltaproteobacteria bacterium]
MAGTINIPTYLTIARIILTPAVIYLILSRSSVILTIVLFAVAAITDYIDGIIARKFGMVSRLGAHADMIADRVLWAGSAAAMFFAYGLTGIFDTLRLFQLFAIMTRELIAAPFALAAAIWWDPFPPARYVAKVTTMLQGFALPALLLSVEYPVMLYLSTPLAGAILITGAWSAKLYIEDSREMNIPPP